MSWSPHTVQRRWPLAVLAALLLLLALVTGFSSKTLTLGREPAAHESLQAAVTEFSLDGSGRWESVELPDAWVNTRPKTSGMAWYRLQFDVKTPLDKPALYIPRWSMVGAIWWDGRLLEAPPRWDGESPRQLNYPRFHRLDPDFVTPGRHVVVIQLKAISGLHPGLSRVHLGEHDVLYSYFRRLDLWQAKPQQAIGIALFLLGMLVVGLSYAMRDRAFAFAGISMLLWAFSVYGWGSEVAWFGGDNWELYFYLARLSFPYLIGMFIFLYFRMTWRWLPVLMLLAWISVAVPTVLTWPQYFSIASSWIFGGTAVFFMSLLLASLLRGVQQRNTEAVIVSGVLIVAHSVGFHDLSWWAGKSNFAEPMLNQFGGVMLFGTLIVVVLRRYTRIQRELQGLNQELESRVARRTGEALRLAQEAERLNQARALQEERERIFRDLHDDIGAKLLTLAIGAGSPEQSNVARSALSDMRMMLSHSSQGPTPLAFLLADMRSEAASRLADAGLGFSWTAPDLPLDDPGPIFLPSAALDMSRVLREAVSNVLKHAGAGNVRMRVDWQPARIDFVVQDDGRGLAPAAQDPAAPAQAPGHGRRNMLTRVGRWGGEVNWSAPPEGGCVVAWHFPLMNICAAEALATPATQ